MGCSTSKVDDEEAVQLCRDRKIFIKQAIEQRNRLAHGHVAYMQSLRQVSVALHNYINDHEYHNFFSASYTTSPSAPTKGFSPYAVGIPLIFCAPAKLTLSEKSSSCTVTFLRSGANPSVSVDEWPESPETRRIESFYPTDHLSSEGYFLAEVPPRDPSFFHSPHERLSYPPASPQTSQWDLFWNPFLLDDTCGHPAGNSLDRIIGDDETDGLLQLREEGTIELGGENNRNNSEFKSVEMEDDRFNTYLKLAEDVAASEAMAKVSTDVKKVNEVKELRSHGGQSMEVSEAQNAVEISNGQGTVGNRNSVQDTPSFTVYVNRRPMSMAEAIEDIHTQFMKICDSSNEVSVLLEVNKSLYSSATAAVRMLNPASLLHSTQTRPSSSKFIQDSSGPRDDSDENNSNRSEESSVTHKSTLDRLYEWEKKLYMEIKIEERLRIAYEKKCMQLRSHDVHGEEPSVVDKTRAAIRDLRTRLRVSINSVKHIAKRIKTLLDEELHPQLVELIKGLARMWRDMADCHRIQKRTADEAKLLLFPSSAPAAVATATTVASPPRPSPSAARLEAEVRNWHARLAAWVGAQRSYALALAGWIHRCAPPATMLAPTEGEPEAEASHRSPSDSGGGNGAPPTLRILARWARLLESVSEAGALEGVGFFAVAVGAVARRRSEGGPGAPAGEEAAGGGARVVLAGMSAVAGALAEFAGELAAGYEALVRVLEEGGSGTEERAEL